MNVKFHRWNSAAFELLLQISSPGHSLNVAFGFVAQIGVCETSLLGAVVRVPRAEPGLA